MTHKYGDNASAIVVGGGPAGLTAAIALAQGGLPTVLVAKPPTRADNRTTALLAGSVTALETLGVWERCAAQAAPLKLMRIVDDTGRLWRAPEVKFAASEIELEAGIQQTITWVRDNLETLEKQSLDYVHKP